MPSATTSQANLAVEPIAATPTATVASDSVPIEPAPATIEPTTTNDTTTTTTNTNTIEELKAVAAATVAAAMPTTLSSVIDDSSAPRTYEPESVPTGGDPTQFSIAFGRRGITKLVKELDMMRPVQVRQVAIITLVPLLHQPENLAQALKQDVIARVQANLEEASIRTRDLVLLQNGMLLLEACSNVSLGRMALVREKAVTTLSLLIQEQDEFTRRKALEVLERIASATNVGIASTSTTSNNSEEEQQEPQQLSGLDAVLGEPQLKETLLERLTRERYENQATILNLLYAILRASKTLRKWNATSSGDGGQVVQLPKVLATLKTDLEFHQRALPVLMDMLHRHKPANIKAGAAQCLAALFTNDPRTLILTATTESTSGANPEEEAPTSWSTIRKEAIKIGLIPELLSMLGNSGNLRGHSGERSDDATSEVAQPPPQTNRTSVQAQVMQALMGLSVDVEAKQLMVREGGNGTCLQVLTKCCALLFPTPELTQTTRLAPLSPHDSQRLDTTALLLNTIKTMGNIAEDYRARFSFQAALPQLEHVCAVSNNPLLEKAARQTIKVITWRP